MAKRKKVFAYLSIPMEKQKHLIRAHAYRDGWTKLFGPMIANLMDTTVDDVCFVTALTGMFLNGSTSEYKHNELFKVTRTMSNMFGDIDVVCFPEGWENHINCVTEAYTSCLHHLPIIAVDNMKRDKDSVVTDVYLNTANISLGDEELFDEPSEFGMCSDDSDDYTRIFVENTLDLMEITQMRERGC